MLGDISVSDMGFTRCSAGCRERGKDKRLKGRMVLTIYSDADCGLCGRPQLIKHQGTPGTALDRLCQQDFLFLLYLSVVLIPWWIAESDASVACPEYTSPSYSSFFPRFIFSALILLIRSTLRIYLQIDIYSRALTALRHEPSIENL